MPSSRGSSWPRDWTQVPCITDGSFTVSATREAHFRRRWSVCVCVCAHACVWLTCIHSSYSTSILIDIINLLGTRIVSGSYVYLLHPQDCLTQSIFVKLNWMEQNWVVGENHINTFLALEVKGKEFVKRRARTSDEEKATPLFSDKATSWVLRGHAQTFF